MPTFATAFGIHPQSVALRAHRAEILSANLANADIPGYRARDIDFRAVFANDNTVSTLSTTHAAHRQDMVSSSAGYALQYRQPLQASLDENSVDTQLERAAFLDNALRYQASVTFLNGRISGLVSAWRGE
jgi:flagellar basal-body rod protein FlgB